MNWEAIFEEHLRKTGRSEKTVEAYLSDIRQFRAWFERENAEELHPSRVTGVDCLDFRRFQLKEEKVAPSTWNRRRISLIVFAKWAIEIGVLREDPMLGVKEKPVEELPPRWLDEAEYRAVVRLLDKEVNRAQSEYETRSALMYRAMISLMLYAGLRVDEVCSLERCDLEISERKGEVLIRDGKGGKAAKLPLNIKARRALSAWLEYWPPERMVIDGHEFRMYEGRGPFPLWLGRKYEQLSPRSVQNHVQNIGKALEIDHLTPHTFRHTFVRRLLVVKKEPVNVVQKFARHARVETTLSYARVSWNDLERAAENL